MRVYLVGTKVSKSSDSIAPIFDCFDFWNWKCIFCEERSPKFRNQIEISGAWNPGFQQICIFRKIDLFGIALGGSLEFLQSHILWPKKLWAKPKSSSTQTQFWTQIFGHPITWNRTCDNLLEYRHRHQCFWFACTLPEIFENLIKPNRYKDHLFLQVDIPFTWALTFSANPTRRSTPRTSCSRRIPWLPMCWWSPCSHGFFWNDLFENYNSLIRSDLE